MKLTKRDNEIIAFLEEVSIADTSTINQMFFNNSSRACSRRLKILTDNKIIKRLDRKYLNQEYIYYVSRAPRQVQHKLLFSRLLGKLVGEGAEILKYKCPLKIGNVIPDGFICYKIGRKTKVALVEVELTKELDKAKYKELIRSKEFKDIFDSTIPDVIVISDRKSYQMKEFNVINIKTDLINIDNLL